LSDYGGFGTPAPSGGMTENLNGLIHPPVDGPTPVQDLAAPMGAPGGSGRDGDSREHRRASYLIESDTNAIVGELPRTAPPVIGAGEDYR
jgi:hypothetical protein